VPSAKLTTTGLYAIAAVIEADIKYIELGFSDVALNTAHVATQKPVARKPIGDLSIAGGVITASAYFGGASANCAQGTIAASPSPTDTVFTLQSGEGALFQAGQLVRVNNVENKRILSIAGDQLTLVGALGFTPSAGHTVRQMLSEATVWGGSTSSTSIGTGIMYGRALLDVPVYKVSGAGQNITFELTTGIA
jgi:hypothetical protein